MRKHTTIAIILMASIFMLASNGMPFGQRAQKQRLAKDSVAMKDSAAVSDSMAIADNKSMPDTIGMDSLQLAVYHHNKQIDDSIHLDSLNRQRKNGIDAPVEYSANDSIIYDASSNTAFLFGSSKVDYENMNLESDKIYMSLDSSLVHATGSPDSTEEDGLKGKPVFTMGNDT